MWFDCNLTMFWKVVAAFAVFVKIGQISAVTNTLNEIQENRKILLRTIVRKLNEAVISSTVLRVIMDNYLHSNVTLPCRLALSNLTVGLDDGSLAALQFVDATAKIPAGIGEGSLSFLGSFDGCLDSDYPSKETSNFHGKYCIVYVYPGDTISSMIKKYDVSSNGLPLRFDVCLPSSCLETDITAALNNARNGPLSLVRMLGATITAERCHTRDWKPFSKEQITAIVIFFSLVVVLFIATLFDIIIRLRRTFNREIVDTNHAGETQPLFIRVLLSFSMYTNGLSVLNTDMAADSLTAVNGVRFLSMSWVILGHTYFLLTNYNIVGNFRKLTTDFKSFALQPMWNATMAVDSFFFLSGFLVTYTVMKELEKKGTVNWVLYFFHRFWRLTPALAAVILFTFLFPLLGSGPTWTDYDVFGFANCQTNWWLNLLYINNFITDMEKMCLGYGWYLAIDMQFYVVSPLIFIAFHKKSIWGILVNLTFLMVSVIIPVVMTIRSQYQYPPTVATSFLLWDQQSLMALIADIYMKPYCRMGPYCVGIYAGYFLIKKKDLNLQRFTKAFIWCLAIVCNISILYGTMGWTNRHSGLDLLGTLYLATHRTAWAMGLAWVVVCCATGNGCVVNSILSWKIFVPLGRLCYVAYLIHPMIQMSYMGMTRERIVYTQYTNVIMYLGFLSLSYGLAFFATLAVEVPFLKLEKIIFHQAKKYKTNNSSTSATEN